MQDSSIIYPAIAMFALTATIIFYMGFCRYRAVARGDVHIRFFRAYNEGEQTKRLHLISRHVQNHFEAPPLFYVVVTLTYVTGSVTLLTVALAWAYVGARVVHSFVHLGYNNVTHRFFVFGSSVIVLVLLWANLLISLLRSG